MTAEICLALLCALGAGALVWLLAGWLVRPAACRRFPVVLPAWGDGEGLEGGLRWLAWLRGAGLFRGQAVIWDRDLTPAGRRLALDLCLRWPWVTCCPGGTLEEFLDEGRPGYEIK